MNTNKHSVVITAYEYSVLRENSMIAGACARLFESAIEHNDKVKLVITLSELTDLIGFVAAEANHARSKRKSEDLNEICDYLESIEQDIKRQK
jgi:mevalonate kinase